MLLDRLEGQIKMKKSELIFLTIKDKLINGVSNQTKAVLSCGISIFGASH